MNRLSSLIIGSVIGFASMAFAATPKLPPGAILIEQRELPAVKNRALALWMINPVKSAPIPEDEPYTCPDETTGNHYTGAARLSLVEYDSGKLINTIKIHDPDYPEKDEFPLPYEIRPGYYYRVDSTDSSKATILPSGSTTSPASAMWGG